MDEACTNVIKHAHKYDARRKILITTFIDDSRIEVIINDKGKGFDLNNLPEPDLEEYVHKSQKGGLGIHLMRTLMDEVTYSFNPGKNNSVTLIKYLNKNVA